MASVKLMIDRRTVQEDAMYPIRFRIYNNNSSTTIDIGVNVVARLFKGDPLQAVDKAFPNATVINTRVRQKYAEILAAINSLDFMGKLDRMSASDIRAFILSNRLTPDGRMREGVLPAEEVEETHSFSNAIEEHIRNCRAERTRSCYEYANAKLQAFCKQKEISFEELTYSKICAFDRWMEQSGLRMNTRGIVMRNIRCVFNNAIKEDVIPPTLYPFRKFSIKNARKEKDVLPPEVFRKLRDMELVGRKKKARDYFLLSFYLCGINPIDLYNLPLPNSDGIVTFVPQKIAHKEPLPVHLRVEPEAQAIADAYKDKYERLLVDFSNHYPYNSMKWNYAHELRLLGEELGVKLYFYVARYTWATYADHLEVSHDVISKALGHADDNITDRHYIDFDWERVYRANRKVLDYVSGVSH